MTRLFPLRLAVLCAWLAWAGCIVLPAGSAWATAATAPTAAQLAEMVFPGLGDAHPRKLQTMLLPAGTGNTYANWGGGQTRVIVEPKLVVKTDADHLTLVVAVQPAGDDGRPAVTHLTPMGLAAYQFTRAGAGWSLAGRQGIFAWRGFFGAASMRQVTLAEGRHPKQAIGVEYGSCWGGYCGTWLALYELDGHGVQRDPSVELALTGTNVDSAGDCIGRLQPLIKPRAQDPAPHDDAAAGSPHDCYMIDVAWNVEPSRDQPGDLVIRYQGAISRADTPAARPSPIDQRQVLRYGGGKYRAVSGFNPVPPIRGLIALASRA